MNYDLATVFSGLPLIFTFSLHYALTVFQGHHKCGSNAAVLALPLALPYLANPSYKLHVDFFVLFELVIQDLSCNHRCSLEDRGPKS